MTSAWARPGAARARTGLVPGPGRSRWVSLAWPRLPATAEAAIIAAAYVGYALVRLAVKAGRPTAFAHASELWRTERWLHLDIEPSLNQLAAAGSRGQARLTRRSRPGPGARPVLARAARGRADALVTVTPVGPGR